MKRLFLISLLLTSTAFAKPFRGERAVPVTDHGSVSYSVNGSKANAATFAFDENGEMIVLFYAAFTASVTGDWATPGTWGGAGPPTAGDTVSAINSGVTVTVSDARSIGTSGATGTTAITHGGGGTLLVSSAGTLSLFGDIAWTAGTITNNGTITINSPVGTQYKVRTAFGAGALMQFNCVGNSGAHATLNTAGAGTHGYWDLGNTSTVAAGVAISYCDFTNLGESTNGGFQQDSCRHNTVCVDTTIDHLLVKGSGDIRFGYVTSTDGKEVFTVNAVDIRTPVTTKPWTVRDDAAKVAPGVRSRTNITIWNDGAVNNYLIAQEWTRDITIGVKTGNVCTTPGYITYDIIFADSQNDQNRIYECGALGMDTVPGSGLIVFNGNGNVLATDYLMFGHGDNLHFFQEAGSNDGLACNHITKSIFDGDGVFVSDTGDIYLPNNCGVMDYNLDINQAGVLFTLYLSTANLTANHNTLFNTWGGSIGETTGAATQLTSLQSNLVVKTSGASTSAAKQDLMHVGAGGGTPGVFIRQTGATIDYNGWWQLGGSGDSGAGSGPTNGTNIPNVALSNIIGDMAIGLNPLANLVGKTATAGTDTTHIVSTGSDFVANGVKVGDYVIKTDGTGGSQWSYAQVSVVTDATHLTLASALGATPTTFDVRPCYLTPGGVCTAYGTSNFDTHAVHVNPGFVDSTRTIGTWGSSQLGNAGTVIAVFKDMIKVNGYDFQGNVASPNTNATVEKGLTWVRGGFVPTNKALATSAHDGTFIGALQPQAGCGSTLLMMGIGCN